MIRTITVCLSVAYFLVAPRVARAAVVTVDVIIKATDSRGHAVTVAYKVGAEEKAITLDVSRKAEIAINGKESTLDSLKPGQKAKITFEKELQIVTKINAVAAKVDAAKADSARKIYRIKLQLSEFGDVTFRIEKTSKPPEDDFEGTPFTFSMLPHTKATKGPDGMFRLVYDFSDPDDLRVIALGPPTNVTADKDSGTLVFASGHLPEGSGVKKGATFDYGKKWRLPLTVIVDIVQHDDAIFAIQVSDIPRKLGLLQCEMSSQAQSVADACKVRIAWMEGNEKAKQSFTTLYEMKDASLVSPLEKRLRLPLPNSKIDGVFYVRFVRISGRKATEISRLELRGQLSPMFGIGLKESQGVVFAQNIVAGGLAEKAGLQNGDVISAINEKRPSTMAEAVQMLSHVPIGDETVFTIQRGGKTLKIQVVAE